MPVRPQNKIWLIKKNELERLFCVRVSGRVNRIRSAENIAITPPSLLGIDRRIAYVHRKYHSGLIWTGVTMGFAWIKFSGSPRYEGAYMTIPAKRARATMNPTESLEV